MGGTNKSILSLNNVFDLKDKQGAFHFKRFFKKLLAWMAFFLSTFF